MPSLVLFGRRWGIGSDDLVFPVAFDFVIKLSCLISSAFMLWRNYEELECNSSKWILIGFIGTLQFGVATDAALAHQSRKGGILEDHKRKNVPSLLYLRIFLEIIFLCWNILTTIWYWDGKKHSCDESMQNVHYIYSLVVFNWSLLGFQLIFFLYCIDLYPLTPPPEALVIPNVDPSVTELSSYNSRDDFYEASNYSSFWKKRLRFCCCIFCNCSILKHKDDSKDAFREVARMCASRFGGVDLVHSDVVAGLILLSRKHRKDKLMKRSCKREWTLWYNGKQILHEPIANGSDPLQKYWGNDEWRSIKNLSHFLKYASAPFGWAIVAVQQDRPVCQLIKHMNPSNCLPWTKYPLQVEGDNCCYLNTTGLKTTISAEFQDIAHVSFRNKIFETPFFVAVDHSTCSIVIGIRGSMSLNDILLDMLGWPVHIPNYPETFKAHRGMLIASLKINEKLSSLNILPILFGSHPNYQLVITGHSLGSGCATILSMLLKPTYSNVKCYAYSPPGGLLSMDAANYCDDFVTSLTYGDDVITRLGILQFERLKINLLNVLKDSQIPKYQILSSSLCCCSNGIKRESSQDSFKDPIPVQTSPIGQSSDSSSLESCIQKEACTDTKLPSVEEMYPPGKIIHIRSTPRDGNSFNDDLECGKQLKWIWRWAKRTEFDNIIVSRRMLLDHVPLIIPKSLNYLKRFY